MWCVSNGAFSAPCAQMWSCEQTAASSTSSTLLTCQQLSTRWLIKLISATKTGGSDGIKSGSFVCSCLCTEGMVSSQQQALMTGRRLWLLAMMSNVFRGNGKGFGPWPIWLTVSLPKVYTMTFSSHVPTMFSPGTAAGLFGWVGHDTALYHFCYVSLGFLARLCGCDKLNIFKI